MDKVREIQFYIVICPEIFTEYLCQIKKRFAGANAEYLRSKLDRIGVAIKWVAPIDEPLVTMNRKDQHYLNCAHNGDYPAHLLISDDGDFIVIKEDCPIPIILTFSEFMDKTTRTGACGDAKMICKKIKAVGIETVFG